MYEDVLTAGLAPAVAVDPGGIARAVRASHSAVVVLDDDPTGTQSVAGVPVLGRWSEEDFDWAFAQDPVAVYVLTNSRSLDAASAAQINRDAVTAAVASARRHGRRVRFASRGDSTLRGHFPLETDAIAEALSTLGEPVPDGVILAPAFPDAGRVTVGGVHGVLADGVFTPVGDTEFADDATFGYHASRLVDWVVEKSGGRLDAADVVEIQLGTIRRGPDAVVAALLAAPDHAIIVVDALVEDDQRVLALALERVEAGGRTYIYRVGPSFVRARIGQAPPATLTMAAIDPEGKLLDTGGLILVGSHVGLSSRQLAHLVARRPDATVVELPVAEVLRPGGGVSVGAEAAVKIVGALEHSDVILHSSRELVRTDNPDESLAISRQVSAALVEAVRRTIAQRRPRFVVAKGGITSSDVARHGLSLVHAMVRGPMLPGLVSLWEPADGPAVGIPYVVFPGNVGADDSLTAVVDMLSAHGTPSAMKENT